MFNNQIMSCVLSRPQAVRISLWTVTLALSALINSACEDQSERPGDDRVTSADMSVMSRSDGEVNVVDSSVIPDLGGEPTDQNSEIADMLLEVDLSGTPDQEAEPCGGAMNPCPDDPRVELTIISPVDQAQLSAQEMSPLQATLNIENLDPRAVGLYLESSLQGPLEFTYRPDELMVTADLSQLTRGTHILTLSAFVHPDFEWSTQITVFVPCVISADFSEPLDSMLWYRMGDAYRADGGWLEMTDQTPGSMGGIFLIGEPIQASTLDVSFKLAVEAELNLNAPINRQISDGLAMTFWNLPPSAVPILEPILTASGSKMGYGLYRDPLTAAEMMGFMRPEAFTVEFDTYYNACDFNPHQDPTTDPHIAITYDGYVMHPHHTTDDEGNSVEIPISEICSYPAPSDDPDHPWAAIPNLLDGAWHDVRIQILNGDLIVTYDGVEKIRSAEIVNRFKGGILAFSGGSGAVPAHLRFDDLVLNSACQ